MFADNTAEWYSRVASLTRAGIPIPDALRTSFAPHARVALDIADRLDAGEPPRTAWGDHAKTLGKTDVLLLAAGQLSGKFPESCDALAERHAARARTRRKLISGAAYPVIILHVIALLSPFIGCFTGEGSLTAALGGAAVMGLLNIALIWAVIGAVFWVARHRPMLFAAALRPLPLWGASIRHTSLATFCGALAALLRAGVLIGDAWVLAGEASGDARIRAATVKVAAIIEDRRAPGAELPSLGAFPEDFCALYLTGERTGGIERQLDALCRKYDDIAIAKATTASVVYPIGLYSCGILMVAIKVLSFWAGYFTNMTNTINSIG